MSDSPAPNPHASRFGLVVTLVAVGGSAIGVLGWHLLSNRSSPNLDTSGFDMATAPDSPRPAAAPAAASPAAASATPSAAPLAAGGLLLKREETLQLAGSTPPTPAAAAGAAPGTAAAPASADDNPRAQAIKHEKVVDAYVRRMQAKYPSIGQYGRDWVKHPDLVKLRDDYWRDRDPVKFAYGLAKSKNFAELVKKYAGDPGIRATLIGGIKEAPPSLMGAVGGLVEKDGVVKDLVNTVAQAAGLPKSLLPFLSGADTKAPDANQVLTDIMSDPNLKKQMQGSQGAAPVPLDQQSIDKAKEKVQQPNGFTPLGGR